LLDGRRHGRPLVPSGGYLRSGAADERLPLSFFDLMTLPR
jgi:hypothetical protein